ncbi:MAG: hypothetical protein ABH808_02735 [Candidatus Kuenenbacteria bacterium]
MKVSEKLWENTSASGALNIFPGQLGEFFINCNVKISEKTKTFLPHIFWRWYFLECEYQEGTNPYFYLEDLQKKEKWPCDGQFFAQPEIEETKKNNYNISITVDYISFEEQPLIIDLKNILDGKKLIYNYDNKYRSDLNFLVNYCQKQGFNSDNLDINKINQLIKIYLEKNLEEWYNKDILFQEAFTKESWNRFWKKIIKEIGQNKNYNTEQLINNFTLRISQFFPNYNFKLSLDESGDIFKKEKFSSMFFFSFWFNFAYYILLPFSFYLLLLAPAFLDKKCFQQDVNEILNRNNYQDPLPIYAACSYIYFTPFGKKVFKNILE